MIVQNKKFKQTDEGKTVGSTVHEEAPTIDFIYPKREKVVYKINESGSKAMTSCSATSHCL